MKHIACSGMGLVLLLGLTGLPAGAQNQTPSTSQTTSPGPSLGDYARQVRKDPGGTSKPKVYDNDNLPREDKLSVVGQTTATTTANAATATDSTAPAEAKPSSDSNKAATPEKAPSGAPTTPAEDDANKAAADKQWADKITAQKDQIDLLTRELDVLQREYQIRAAAMYADVGNRMRNSADWDKQDTQYKQQIADKQKAVDDAKQKLEDLQEEARKAGAPASVRE
ncbi:MAG TPA: hypothetical protein VIX37_18060 [Candidatus Sulfotelmatobacter sp.]